VQLEPRDKIAQGRELICEGQIARIRSRYMLHGRVQTNPKLLSQAIGHFQQAAELMPNSPDPYLAMAPVYLYYEQDYERGMAMQEAAVKRGHTAGKRETAQMADTLKANARRDLALAQELDDNPERKKQHLQNAISAFDSSIEYYGQIAGFASSSSGLRDAMQGRQQAQKLLDQMQAP
jgi:tetratricopeptide (TPR) repeat protein